MGLTIFRTVFEVIAVIIFLIYFICLENDLDEITKYLKRMRGMLRRGGDEKKAMTGMLEEFIGKPCRIQADGFDEEDQVVIPEVDGEWLKVSYMEASGHKDASKKRITQILRVDDVASIKTEEGLGEIVLEGGAKSEPPEDC